MRHPSLEQLRDFAATGPGPRRRGLEGHLARCAGCRESVAWIHEVRQAAADVTALSAPAGAWERIAARVATGESVLLPTPEQLGSSPGALSATGFVPASELTATAASEMHAVPTSGLAAGLPQLRRRSPALRAALLVLGLAGVASATVPGSPVRAWIGRVLPFATAGSDAGPATATAGSPAAGLGTDELATDEPAMGPPDARLLVPLSDDALTIRIERPHPELRIRVHVGAEPEVLIHASGGAAGGRFSTGAGRLTIEGAGDGEVVIGIPAGPGRITLEVGGRPFLLKEAGQLQILAPVADTIGSEFIFSLRRGGAPDRP